MVANLSIKCGDAYESINKIFRKELAVVVPISEALNLMFSFGSFIVLLLGLVIAMVKLSQKKINHLLQL
ncbi:putative holin-like toxin [Mammaliicoccus sciuri]|nr:putative holin-like toxin [Mammaliicoccus sciuri]MCD8896388.1 putative holin-like toxin [Mammaliicoccus sciuri]